MTGWGGLTRRVRELIKTMTRGKHMNYNLTDLTDPDDDIKKLVDDQKLNWQDKLFWGIVIAIGLILTSLIFCKTVFSWIQGGF